MFRNDSRNLGVLRSCGSTCTACHQLMGGADGPGPSARPPSRATPDPSATRAAPRDHHRHMARNSHLRDLPTSCVHTNHLISLVYIHARRPTLTHAPASIFSFSVFLGALASAIVFAGSATLDLSRMSRFLRNEIGFGLQSPKLVLGTAMFAGTY